jgi:diguanylate cyclase (GGDEF)-like protein
MNGQRSAVNNRSGVAHVTPATALDHEGLSSQADQSAADADATASDADQDASERDDADAVSDQRVADQEQAIADRATSHGPGGASNADGNNTGATNSAAQSRDDARHAREVTRASRLTTHGVRNATAVSRLRIAAARDATGMARDETARLRDLRAEAIEQSVADSDAPLAEKLARFRVRAAADRAGAASDRARAAKDREDAARERAALETELHGAYIDDLTGALRRKLGMVALTHELERARRGDGLVVFVFIDVDDLKMINDRDGHVAGDHVLQTLVSIMRASLRSFDPIVRFGGDEFVCAMGRVDLANVEQRLEEIDQALRTAVGTGICVGLAALTGNETLAEIMTRADSALLAAKRARAGRAPLAAV